MYKLFIADLKMMFRNRQALFWTLLFPLVFTFIFGLFFGKSDVSAGTLALVQDSHTVLSQNIVQAIQGSGVFTITQATDLNQAKTLINTNKANVALLIPNNFGAQIKNAPTNLQIIYDPGNNTSYSVLTGLINNILTEVNLKVQGARSIYGIQASTTTTRSYTYFDFILIGLIGMALMNSSIQGVAIAMSTYREKKIFKRITSTPLSPTIFILSEVLSRLVLNFVQVSLILLVGVYGFKAHIYGNIFLVYLISLIGGLLFQAIGFAVAASSKTTQSAEGMSQAITLPMMFLAGVFFPIDQLPKIVYNIVRFLPLAPLLRILRGVAIDSVSPLQSPKDILLVLAWVVVMLWIAIRRFRLSDE